VAVVLQWCCSELFFSSFFSGQAAVKLSKTGRAMATLHHLCPNTDKGRRASLNLLKKQLLQCSRLPPPLTSLHSAPSSGLLRKLTNCLRLDFMACSARLLVMPHSATSSAMGDEISTTLNWNSGVNSSQ
jgi:hypothetical protein